MGDDASFSVREPDKKKRWLTCQRCEKSTLHTTLTTVGESDETPNGEVQFWTDYLTVVCNGCNAISLCIASTCSEARDFETGEFDVSYKYYPHGCNPILRTALLAMNGLFWMLPSSAQWLRI
jgi:hypothetical protein